ncbi:protein of unknown function [Stenotrophomonas sp. yr243]|uniref:DUF4189 domain-containing protein n=2 Tax=Stenotrophomonas TaxID=40323 RepID=UPI000CC8C6F9|nr:protein of unknown function [Stenotrophomonas sp. yr243]
MNLMVVGAKILGWEGVMLRRYTRRLCACLVLGGISLGAFQATAFAEGGCPAGQYPIGGQGVQGCAPIPGAGGGDSTAPRATGRWIKTWGAISVSPDGKSGVAVGKRSKSEAEGEAMGQCVESGGQGCRASFAYKNQCVAAVVPSSGRGGTSFGGGETVEKAAELANSVCRKGGGEGCHSVYTACTAPEYVKY